MMHRILRLFAGWVLPIPMIVALFTIVCDVFHLNKDSQYIRLSDSSMEHIAMDYALYLFLGAMVLGIPCLFYTAILEFRRRRSESPFPFSLGIGLCVGVFVGIMVIPPLPECSLLDCTEGFVHCLAITLTMGLLIPVLLGDLSWSKLQSEQDAAGNPLPAE